MAKIQKSSIFFSSFQLLVLLVPILFFFISTVSSYQIGAGIWDITGPAVEVGFMGYAMPGQTGKGIHLRLRARAFIFADGNKRFVFASTDSCMIFTFIKLGVLQQLQKKYGNLYTKENVLLSGIHTHSGPAGYAHYAIYDITSFGYQEGNYNTIVNGIVSAISMAHDNLSKEGDRVFMNSGELLDSNINRSPTAYLNNPASERAKYKYDVDKLMVLLKLQNANGSDIGLINWFSVHGTSMNNTNQFVSGDNKGYASYVFEKFKNGNRTLPGRGPFIAAFAQTNEGDVSPNTKGAFCSDGTPCEQAHSTCGGYSEDCHGYGPGKDCFESTQIIGTKQFRKALELFQNATIEIKGPIDYIHLYVDMSNVTIPSQFTSTGMVETTCVASLGDSFAAGTTDGPGAFDFTQGTNDSSPNEYWNFIAHFLSDPTDEDVKCQHPKPILLNTGGIDFPAPWTAKIVTLQILRLGQFYIIGVPGEFSTMSGRRLRDTVLSTLLKYGASNDSVVVIAGLSNDYTHYITTYEEFQVQRYEGASTLYGPHTLAAYQYLYSQLAQALITGKPYPPGPNPPNIWDNTFNFLPGVLFDIGDFGTVQQQPKSSYKIGETVTVVFIGANPRNNFRTQDSFLTVEKLVNGKWEVILTDGDWDTKFQWDSYEVFGSYITVQWTIDASTEPGTYIIRHFGDSKDIYGTITPYQGASNQFQVS